MDEPARNDLPELEWFGFEDDENWLSLFREAELPGILGAIGPYQVVSELGRGGQGVVYRVRQPGTNREIALKRLRAGTGASPAARRRFEREIEAAAALSHPCIVTAYAADLVDGAPLLAMELVDGKPLTEWAAERSHSEVVRLFSAVCDAVQHAHGRGVIHRDLKPSNILVATGPDGDPTPKVLDFGLARLSSLPEASQPDQFIGTPAYAAPEQAAGRLDEVDARSDVYSLGMVLLNALGISRLHESGPVKGLDDSLAAVLRRATAQHPENRYPSVSALADDVRRYAAGEPVLARPPSTREIVGSLVRRHRTVCYGAAAFMAAVLLSAATLSVMSYRLAAQRRIAVEALAREHEARLTAEHVTEYVRGILVAGDPNLMGSSEVRVVDVLDRAAAYASPALQSEPAAAAAIHHTLGVVYAGLSRFPDAERQFREPLPYFRAHPGEGGTDLVEGLRCLGASLFYQDRFAEAEPLCSEAVALARSNASTDPAVLTSALIGLAEVHCAQGRFSSAEQLLRESIAVAEHAGYGESMRVGIALDRLAKVQLQRGNADDAIESFRRALSIHETSVGENSTSYAIDLKDLAQALQTKGDLDGAEEALRRALTIEQGILKRPHPLIEETEKSLEEVHVRRAKIEGRPPDATPMSAPAPPG